MDLGMLGYTVELCFAFYHHDFIMRVIYLTWRTFCGGSKPVCCLIYQFNIIHEGQDLNWFLSCSFYLRKNVFVFSTECMFFQYQFTEYSEEHLPSPAFVYWVQNSSSISFVCFKRIVDDKRFLKKTFKIWSYNNNYFVDEKIDYLAVFHMNEMNEKD